MSKTLKIICILLIGIGIIIPFIIGLGVFKSKQSNISRLLSSSVNETNPRIAQYNDQNYVTILSKNPMILQVQGSLEQIDFRGIEIRGKDTSYSMLMDDRSVIECRDKYIALSKDQLVLAQTVYLDLSKYVDNLKTNRETYIKQGKLLRYKDAYKKVGAGSIVAVTGKALNEKPDAPYILDLMMVYGCN